MVVETGHSHKLALLFRLLGDFECYRKFRTTGPLCAPPSAFRSLQRVRRDTAPHSIRRANPNRLDTMSGRWPVLAEYTPSRMAKTAAAIAMRMYRVKSLRR